MRNKYYEDKIDVAIKKQRRRKRALRQLINCLGGILWCGGIIIAGSEAAWDIGQHNVCIAGLAMLVAGSAIIFINR